MTLLQREPHIGALISRIFDKWSWDGTGLSKLRATGPGVEHATQWKTGELRCLALKGQSLLSETASQAGGAGSLSVCVCAGLLFPGPLVSFCCSVDNF